MDVELGYWACLAKVTAHYWSPIGTVKKEQIQVKNTNAYSVFRVVWWLTLVATLSWFLQSRLEAFSDAQASIVDVVVFLVWIALLIAPIFKEVEIFGVKIRHELQAAKEELRHEIAVAKADITSSIAVQNSNSATQTINWLAPPDSLLPLIEERIKQLVGEQVVTGQAVSTQSKVDQAATTLFSYRYQIEKELRRLAAPLQSSRPRGFSVRAYLEALEQREVIDYALASAVRDVYAICSIGVHGEPLSEMQDEFVQKAAPQVLAALRAL